MSFSPQFCTNSSCPFQHQIGGNFNKKGFFRIKRLNQVVRRFQCLNCRKTFCSRSFKPDYRHKKMDLNTILQKFLSDGNSLRSSARLLGLTYKNTYNKFLWLTEQARKKKSLLRYSANTLYFDEMETIHHTKCKPLSIAVVVTENYQILDLRVAKIPAKGLLASLSVKKYGLRPDERDGVMDEVFQSIKSKLESEPVLIKSDAKPSYRKFVNRYFPKSIYEVHSRSNKERHRARLHEKMQQKIFDPMFALNQRCAKLRSDIRRLTRRSWCTTKKPENLQGHLDLYLLNQFC